MEAAVLAGTNLAVKTHDVRVLRRWGDVAKVRVSLSFRAKKDVGRTEAYASVAPGLVFAISSARVEHGGQRLDAAERPAAEAGAEYLATVARIRDPLLLTRKGPGRFDLRVFPVEPAETTRVVVEGWALLERTATRDRLYRTGDRVLAVAADGERAYEFLTDDAARERDAALLRSATLVPCVAALEAALGTAPLRWLALEPAPDGGEVEHRERPPAEETTVTVGARTAGGSFR
jgi:hypothetical protein